MGFLATGFSFQEAKQLKEHMERFADNYNDSQDR